MDRDALTTLQLSATQFPDRERVEAFREIFGRAILQVDMEPLNDQALHADMRLRAFSGLAIATGSLSPVRSRHLAERSDNDDPVLVMMQSGLAVLEQNGRRSEVTTGQAVLTVNGATATFTGCTATCVTNLRLSRRLLAPHVTHVDEALRAPLLRDGPALRLLWDYAKLLDDAHGLDTPQLRQSVAAHVHELAGLAIGGRNNELPTSAGVGAARLCAIKNDIMADIADRSLTIDRIAARHGITPRYVRKMFESEQTSFSEFVLDRRLARAHAMLSSPRHLDRAISAVAFDCGFGDLSYFNRTFRRRFGATPSDIRAGP
jgi:AraC-like DNA-binding protein